MNKSQAIRTVNFHLGDSVLTHSNTVFANVNKGKPVWWFNITPHRFGSELHLLLAKNREVIWLSIEANAFPDLGSVFRIRPDRGSVDLEISASGNSYMRDIKSGGTGYDFMPHVRKCIGTQEG